MGAGASGLWARARCPPNERVRHKKKERTTHLALSSFGLLLSPLFPPRAAPRAVGGSPAHPPTHLVSCNNAPPLSTRALGPFSAPRTAHAAALCQQMPPRLAAAAADPGPRPRLLLATAHPDDEALFFVPALLGVGRGGGPLADVAVVDVVCLSTGA